MDCAKQRLSGSQIWLHCVSVQKYSHQSNRNYSDHVPRPFVFILARMSRVRTPFSQTILNKKNCRKRIKCEFYHLPSVVFLHHSSPVGACVCVFDMVVCFIKAPYFCRIIKASQWSEMAGASTRLPQAFTIQAELKCLYLPCHACSMARSATKRSFRSGKGRWSYWLPLWATFSLSLSIYLSHSLSV